MEVAEVFAAIPKEPNWTDAAGTEDTEFGGITTGDVCFVLRACCCFCCDCLVPALMAPNQGGRVGLFWREVSWARTGLETGGEDTDVNVSWAATGFGDFTGKWEAMTGDSSVDLSIAGERAFEGAGAAIFDCCCWALASFFTRVSFFAAWGFLSTSLVAGVDFSTGATTGAGAGGSGLMEMNKIHKG